MKILFVTPEALPFAKTGGLADVCFSLPKALSSLGHDVSIIMPGYRCVKKEGLRYFYDIKVQIAEHFEDVVFQYKKVEGIDYYFLFCDKYFDREGLYGEGGKDYPDNAERFSLFCKASVELAQRLSPDVIHCHDWQTGLVPALLKMRRNIPSLFTIHNMAYQGLFPQDSLKYTGLPHSLFHPEGVEFYGKVSFIKAGIIFSEIINTVSKGYAEEIKTEEFGFGLQGLLSKMSYKLYGIINGIDYKEWNPEEDHFIYYTYSAASTGNKRLNKKALCKELGLYYDKDLPLLGMVTRMVEQKGIDLLLPISSKVTEIGLFVLLGTGEKKFEDAFREWEKNYPHKVSINIKYDNRLAHRIYAGADIFLMPSRFEPCGLGQLISLKYGTLPLVRATGGLADTVKDIEEGGVGFVFKEASSEALLSTIERAAQAYKNKKLWSQLIKKAMKQDFSWTNSAREYLTLYKEAIKRS